MAWRDDLDELQRHDRDRRGGATYAYRVRARDAQTNVSGYSTSVSVTAQSGPPPPPPSGTVKRGPSPVADATATATSFPQPSGAAAGDVLVACIATNGGGVSSTGMPAGWQPIASALGVANPHVFGYYHVVGSTEPTSWTWGLSSAVTNGGGIVRYSGVDAATRSTLRPSRVPGPWRRRPPCRA